MSPKIRQIPRGLLAVVLVALTVDIGWAQWGTGTNPAPLTGTPGMTTIPPAGTLGPSSTLQQPTYDPYSTQSNSSLSPPSLLSPPAASPYGSGTAAPTYSQSFSAQPPAQPYYGQPPAQPSFGQPPAYPGFGAQTPPTLFPQGLFGTPQTAAPATFGAPSPMRLFQNWQLSDAWLWGDGEGDLQIHDIYTSTTIALPNFLWSGQPWFVSPGFGLHLWSDPAAPGTQVALPSRAYSLFLDLGWKSDPNNAFGVELAGRLGYYSDFDATGSSAFRPKGVALLRYNLTPNLALKAGVDYINRSDIKLLPAGGFLWTPNPKTYFDIYFPQPKLASYLTTLGTRDLWWYIGAEYGGGVWSVMLDDADPALPGLQPAATVLDINDYRVFLGIEFTQPSGMGLGKRNAFLEIGYVFEREVVLQAFPALSYTVGDTFMLRGGLSF